MHLIRKRNIKADSFRDSVRDSFGRIMAKHNLKPEKQLALVERSRVL